MNVSFPLLLAASLALAAGVNYTYDAAGGSFVLHDIEVSLRFEVPRANEMISRSESAPNC